MQPGGVTDTFLPVVVANVCYPGVYLVVTLTESCPEFNWTMLGMIKG